MYFDYDDKLKITLCFTETKDKCSTCINFDICPLVHCIENNMVVPHYENINIKDCLLYEFAEYHKM